VVVSAPGAEAPVAGRETESAELRALLDGVATGRASALLVSGEAGIGKTALVRQTAETAPVRLLWTVCLPLSSLATPLMPLRAVGPELVDDPLLEMDAWLDRCAADGPTVLVVDDVQWADASTLDVLHYVIAGPAGRRFGLVLTLRTGDAQEHGLRRWLADVRRLPRVSELRLGRLDRVATRDQIAGLLGKPPTESLVDSVQSRAQGNPYLTSLLVRGLNPDAQQLPDGLPIELRDALARAWHGLPAEARRLTSEVAVAGRPQTGFGDADVPSLRAAVEAGVLRVDRPGRYWFAHPLLAEVLVGELLPEERQALHAAAARRLAPAGGTPNGMTVDEIVSLADHYDRAGQAEPAFQWACHGAEAAGGSVEALRLLRRAHELLPTVQAPGTSRVALLTRIRSAARERGLAADELAAVDELLAELDPAAEPLVVAELLVKRAQLRDLTGLEYAPASVVAEAVRISAVEPSSPEHAYAMAFLASYLNWRADPAARPTATKALELARASGSDWALAVALLADLECRAPVYDGSVTRQALEARAIAARNRSFITYLDLTFCALNGKTGTANRVELALWAQSSYGMSYLDGRRRPSSGHRARTLRSASGCLRKRSADTQETPLVGGSAGGPADRRTGVRVVRSHRPPGRCDHRPRVGAAGVG
jgi:hypothetical protein